MSEATTASRAKRRHSMPVWIELIADIAPVAPPCFDSRDAWTNYLTAAALDDGDRPIVRTPAGPAIDRNWSFCSDCTEQYRQRMEHQGRCRPDHLKESACA